MVDDAKSASKCAESGITLYLPPRARARDDAETKRTPWTCWPSPAGCFKCSMGCSGESEGSSADAGCCTRQTNAAPLLLTAATSTVLLLYALKQQARGAASKVRMRRGALDWLGDVDQRLTLRCVPHVAKTAPQGLNEAWVTADAEEE